MAASIATELHAVAATNKRLQIALQHARIIKTVTTVEPPLPINSIETDVDRLLDDIAEHYDQLYRFAAIETAARDIFYSLIVSSTIESPEFVEVWNLFDILLAGGDRGRCAPELVVWLIEELLDSQTTEGCKIVFDYLESRRERLAQKDFHKKNLVFLRSCNELLRRLSRAEDASFCGRVFFFLFQTFPLGDKSSVNLRGEYHVENTTSFDGTSAPINTVPEPHTTLDSADGASTPAKQPTTLKPGPKPTSAKSTKQSEEVLDNNTLYPIFWRLQQSFSDPTRLFKPTELQSFKSALSSTITRFKKTPTVAQTSASLQMANKLKRRAGDDEPDLTENYNPKYLTSRDLFDLELSDQAFQRNILVQSLILLNFLLSLTEKAKKKLSEIEHPNKSLLYDFTLNAEDASWAFSTTKIIVQQLMSTPDGRFYERTVQTILARDRNWVRWKIESCPSIVRDTMSTDETFEIRGKIQRAAKPRRVDARIIGSMELGFLENDQSGGLESLAGTDRFTAPNAEQLLQGIKTDELDLEMAMDDEEKASLGNLKQNKIWRLLRDTTASGLALLDQYDGDKDLAAMFSPPLLRQNDTVDVAA